MRFLLSSLMVLSLLVSQGAAQETPEPDSAPEKLEAQSESRIMCYPVRHVDPEALAESLGRAFRDRGEISITVAPNKCLLVSAPPAQLDGIGQLLSTLDRAPLRFRIDVTLAGLDAAMTAELAARKSLPQELLGTNAAEWVRVGKGVTFQRSATVAAVENESASAQTSQQRHITVARGGRFSPSRPTAGQPAQLMTTYQARDFGTIVTAEPSMSEDGRIAVKLVVESTRLLSASKAEPRKKAEAAASNEQDRTAMTQFDTSVQLMNGQVALVSQTIHSNGEAPTSTVLLVSARVIRAQAEKPETGRAAADSDRRNTTVYQLKHVAAEEVAAVIREIYRDIQAQISIGVDERSNSLVVSISPELDSKTKPQVIELLKQLDSARGAPQQRIVPLPNRDIEPTF